MKPRRQVSYLLSLALAVAALVLVTGGWIAWWNYRSGLANARSLAGKLFDQVAHQTAEATGAFLMRAPPAAETVRGLSADDDGPIDSDVLARRLLAVLGANSQFTWVSVSDAAGSFTGVYRTADGKLRVNQSKLIDGKTVLDERDVQADGTWQAFRHDPDTKYDPRTRAFYKLAETARHGVWTPPFVFAEGVPGITYAEPIIVRTATNSAGELRGVVTIDFDLRRMSDLVKSLRFSEHGRVAIVSDEGFALAHPVASLVASTGPKMERAGERRRAGPDKAAALIRAIDLDDPALRANLAAGANASDFSIGGMSYLSRSVTMPIPNGPAWNVIAYAPENDFTAGLQGRVMTSLLISLAAVLIAVIVAWILARRVSGPLTALAGDMAEVGEFRLTDAPQRHSLFREIEMMNVALAKMKGGLRSFARYVPRDLVRAVLASGQDAVLAGDVRELTVYFSDLAGFTTLSERMKPDELVRFLGEYFQDMSEIIATESGTVDKYLGDGIMAFWGAPIPLSDHAIRACSAALRCHRRIGELAARGTEIKARIGIATGDVLVGNIGSPDRMNYTVMGDTANLASRVESINKQYGTSLMISETTYAQAKAAVVARPIDIVAVKGKQRGVRIYELLALVSDHDAKAEALAAESTVAIDAYLARDFTAAVAAWNRVLDRRPGDVAATMLRDRALAFVTTPPPAEWAGVTVATEK